MTRVPATTPYPWPWHGSLDPARLALVVAGWDRASGAAVAGAERVIENLTSLGRAVSHVVTVGRRPGDRSDAERAMTPLAPGRELHLACAGVDAFYGSALDHLLRQRRIDTLLVAGLGLETAVHSTLRSANDRGLECLLVVDACAPLDPDLVAPSVSMIEMSGGIFGAVGTTENVLAALRGAPIPTEVNR